MNNLELSEISHDMNNEIFNASKNKTKNIKSDNGIKIGKSNLNNP